MVSLKNFFKYLFVLKLLQIKVFGKLKFWGKSSKISKDYLGRGDTVVLKTGRGCDNAYLKLPKISGGREGGGLKTRDTACHPSKF